VKRIVVVALGLSAACASGRAPAAGVTAGAAATGNADASGNPDAGATASAPLTPTLSPRFAEGEGGLLPAARPPRLAPVRAAADPSSLSAIRTEFFLGTGELPPAPALRPQVFPQRYSEVDGVLTFRGGPARTGGATGVRRVVERRLEVAWRFKTSAGGPRWGGGAGWTGEPVVVRWPDVVRHSMPALGARRTDPALVEVIQGSLDGNVYFLDLRTGLPTRPPIRTGNPIKGSVSLDPRGWPLLFVGQGIPAARPIGLRLYSLVSGEEIYFLPGRDPAARRPWGAFDSSGLLNRETDTYLVGGENGIVYLLDLHTDFDPIAMDVKVAPRVVRYRFRDPRTVREGIESSLAVYRNLAFFADNSGTIQAVDLATFRPAWAFEAGDDTDASLVLDEEPTGPVLYTASEVDAQGETGFARLRKLDALTGAVLWQRDVACRADHGGPHRTDAGVFATPLVGRDDVSDRVMFTLSRCPDRGAVLALRKTDGAELWRVQLRTDAWSSPTAVHDAAAARTWVLQADRGGRLLLLDPADGTVAFTLPLDGTIEASPAVYDDLAVVGTRAGTIYGIRVR
jgi:outer membrane protein assembly factor BamB